MTHAPGFSRWFKAAVTTLAAAIPVAAHAQRSATAATAAPLVFDGVTVVDVASGKLLPERRVVIVGSRIRAVGKASAIKMPPKARVVPARGKYLIPGLWDLHTHPSPTDMAEKIFYPLFLANGITGIRETGSVVPLETLVRWRREILAGTRVGPPRQILSGPSINHPRPGQGCYSPLWICVPGEENRRGDTTGEWLPPAEWAHRRPLVVDSSQIARMRQVVDSLRAAGADMIKPRELSREAYFVVAAEARRLGVPFGGHGDLLGALEASDSGASVLDHLYFYDFWPEQLCGVRPPALAQCRSVAEHLRRNGTWLEADQFNLRGDDRRFDFSRRMRDFWAGSLLSGDWLRGPSDLRSSDSSTATFMHIMQEADMPILAGSDVSAEEATWREGPAGFVLHANLAEYVALGFSPLFALQTATLNPAKLLHGTDSLGTVSVGKLADLVLLDADPLVDITNTTTIRAVVANGRYFDRAALDRLLTEVQAEGKRMPPPPSSP